MEKVTSTDYGGEYAKLVSNALEYKADTKTKFTNIINALSPKAGDIVLDVGCGTGHYPQKIALMGADVTAIDFSADLLNKARQLRGEVEFNVLRGDVEKLPFKDAYFTKVLSIDVIEHLYHPKKYLKEMYRVMGEGSKLILTTQPNNIEVTYLFLELLKKTGLKKQHFLDEIYHITLYNPFSMKKIVAEAGFKVKKIRTYRILGPMFDIFKAERNDILDNPWLCNSVLSYMLGHGILLEAEKATQEPRLH